MNSRIGAIAQLGERVNGIHEVGGSTPPGSTINTKSYNFFSTLKFHLRPYPTVYPLTIWHVI